MAIINTIYNIGDEVYFKFNKSVIKKAIIKEINIEPICSKRKPRILYKVIWYEPNDHRPHRWTCIERELKKT